MLNFVRNCEFPHALLQKFCFKLWLLKQINALLIQKGWKCFLAYTALGEVSYITFIK